jgi:hypothetical protein
MRTTRWARWATCALALSICVPALAKSKVEKSISDCTSFNQTEKSESAIDMSIHNSCSIPVDCTVTWRIVCAPDAPKRRAAHPKSAKFTLPQGMETTTEATAAECGDDSFSIDQVTWSCEPNKS